MKITHVSSVHPGGDSRIRLKEIEMLRTSGAEVSYVTGDLGYEDKSGISVIRIYPGRKWRVLRIFLTAPLAAIAALRTRADIYHFHDPELMPWFWLPAIFGKTVIYDIHEDYISSVMQKRYVPSLVRRPLSWLIGTMEDVLSRPFVKVVAEKYYKKRFPGATEVLNYPSSALLEIRDCFDGDSETVLYTGNITVDRGALNLAKLAARDSEIRVHAIGQCSCETEGVIREVAGASEFKLRIVGVGRYVPFREIVETYAKGGWLAGIAVFPPTEHYRKKELTKIFEYMACGLPVVGSNFEQWRLLIEGNGVGLCVEPGDNAALIEALTWMKQNPQAAKEMGERGRQLVEGRCNWEQEGKRLTQLYNSLM